MAILRNIPNDAYHADLLWCSHSRIRDFHVYGPRYYYERWVTGTLARKETAALRFGTAFDVLLQLGGEAFERLIAVAPKGLDGRTKEGKAWRAANASRICIDHAEYETMLEMVRAIRECEPGMAVTHGAEMQVTLREYAYGLALQSRPDWLHLEGCVISAGLPCTIDLKTTKDLGDLNVRDGATSLGYHTQAALSRKLLQRCLAEMGVYTETKHYIWCVSKEYPHASQLLEIPSRVLDWADKFLEKTCGEIRLCMDTDTWPRAIQTIGEVRIPRWANTQAADNDQTFSYESSQPESGEAP